MGPLGHVVEGTGVCKSRIIFQKEWWGRWRFGDWKLGRVVGFPLQSKTKSILTPCMVCDCLLHCATTSKNLKRSMMEKGIVKSVECYSSCMILTSVLFSYFLHKLDIRLLKEPG